MALLDAPQGDYYGGYSRFELELEFVQLLANPAYLNHLATQKTFDSPEFVNYLSYLQYFKDPKYSKFLHHPGPTLRALELLQQKEFRQAIIRPDVVAFLEFHWLQSALPKTAK